MCEFVLNEMTSLTHHNAKRPKKCKPVTLNCNLVLTCGARRAPPLHRGIVTVNSARVERNDKTTIIHVTPIVGVRPDGGQKTCLRNHTIDQLPVLPGTKERWGHEASRLRGRKVGG